MASKTKNFGAILREKRLDRGFGLREFATMVGVSSDAWIALAGRVPDDLEPIIQRQPILIPALIREADGLLPEQLSKLIESAKKMKRSKS